MTRRFTLSAQAEADVDAIAEYLARESIDLGLRFYDAAWATFEALAEMPRKGRPRDFADPALRDARSWPIDGFQSVLAFYLPSDEGVRVLRVMHGARDLDAELGGKPPTK